MKCDLKDEQALTGQFIIYTKYVKSGFFLSWFICIFLSLMFGIVRKQLATTLKGVLLWCIHAGVITFQTETTWRRKDSFCPTVPELSEVERAYGSSCSHHGRTGSWDKLQRAITPLLVIQFEQFDSVSSHQQHSHFPDSAQNMNPGRLAHYSNHSTTLNDDQEVTVMIISKEMSLIVLKVMHWLHSFEASDNNHNNESWRSIVNTLLTDRLPDCTEQQDSSTLSIFEGQLQITGML